MGLILKQNFCFDVNGRFESIWCVTLYLQVAQVQLLDVHINIPIVFVRNLSTRELLNVSLARLRNFVERMPLFAIFCSLKYIKVWGFLSRFAVLGTLAAWPPYRPRHPPPCGSARRPFWPKNLVRAPFGLDFLVQYTEMRFILCRSC